MENLLGLDAVIILIPLLQGFQKSRFATVPDNNWARDLASWAIPKEILDQAETTPFIHPVSQFDIPKTIEITASHQRAIEVNPESILDIGCGGGIAAFATQAPLVIGVDQQQGMLDLFTKNALERGRNSQTFLGNWQDIANDVPKADVVAVHHVLYNVPELDEFLIDLNRHAKKRVVIEIPTKHPISDFNPAWKHFWNLDRPTKPDGIDVVSAAKQLGIDAKYEIWQGDFGRDIDLDQTAEILQIRLCLPVTRRQEVKEYLMANPREKKRELITIWWDV